MASEPQLDLTEFVSKLIHDTFNAITVSSKEQAEAYFELTRLASLDYESFRDKYITDEAVDEELTRLFPSGGEDPARPHLVYAGAPYHYDKGSGRETPALYEQLGYTTGRSQRQRKTLAAETVAAARELVQNTMADQHYASFKEIIKRGIPRVIIDSGRILAKLSLKASKTDGNDEAATGDTAGSGSAAVSHVKDHSRTLAGDFNQSLLSRHVARKLASTRVDVLLPDPGGATTQTNASLWGEVEIKFRTVA
ncbi:MAG: hypothetical protein R6U29_02195 [Desulfosudaceae bacterium]